ncbi:SIR2 family NAD-dependent protein deacylase [Cellulomonas sp. FA1]|uniref:SIR2 family NAD-dependent protein deacylase n=1 Tax=Cellulomonas sp. FA1 TaxID=1346710 RepID=UPI00069C6530|nr:SIR2 family protein [Cellulomonas sp. FA1]
MSPVVIPDSLATELAERRCVVVLGAGASAAASNALGAHPPTWDAFLNGALGLLTRKGDADAAREQIAIRRYLDAAQIIVDGLPPADFSKYVRDCFERPRFEASKIHELVLELDPKIVVTTNYDDLYEALCRQGAAVEGYNVCRYYEEHAVNDLRSDRRLILKAHGCISNPSRIILTREQYFTARRDHPSFYSVLDALMLTNTLLFIGCSMDSDPDVQLLLENSSIAAPSQHPHYAIVEDLWHPAVERVLAKTYNMNFLKFDPGDYRQVQGALEDLLGMVRARRALPS